MFSQAGAGAGQATPVPQCAHRPDARPAVLDSLGTMKPHVICHMVSSVDGRTWQSRQRPAREKSGNLFETLHDQLEGDAWLVGRVTGREFAKKDSYPAKAASQTYPRTPWIAKRDAAVYGIVLDAQGKIAWGRSDIGGDPIVVVLTEQVPDAHLEALRGEGMSYLFAGKQRARPGAAAGDPEQGARHQAPAARGRRQGQRLVPAGRPGRRAQPRDRADRRRRQGRRRTCSIPKPR